MTERLNNSKKLVTLCNERSLLIKSKGIQFSLKRQLWFLNAHYVKEHQMPRKADRLQETHKKSPENDKTKSSFIHHYEVFGNVTNTKLKIRRQTKSVRSLPENVNENEIRKYVDAPTLSEDQCQKSSNQSLENEIAEIYKSCFGNESSTKRKKKGSHVQSAHRSSLLEETWYFIIRSSILSMTYLPHSSRAKSQEHTMRNTKIQQIKV
jgi:hypothetical protein